MRLLSGFIVLMTLVGCSSLPPKTEAIHHALVTDSALRQAVQYCSELGIEESRLAEREQANWWQRNNRYVLAADYGVLELNWEQIPAEAESQRAVLAMQLLDLIQQDADDQLSNWFGDYRESEDCRKVFAKVNKGRFDVEKEKKIARELALISARRQDVTGDAEAARSINSRYRKYGRSLFVVEKILKSSGCSSPTVSLLRNSWPLEVYDAVCSKEDYKIVQCEWGRCELKR